MRFNKNIFIVFATVFSSCAAVAVNETPTAGDVHDSANPYKAPAVYSKMSRYFIYGLSHLDFNKNSQLDVADLELLQQAWPFVQSQPVIREEHPYTKDADLYQKMQLLVAKQSPGPLYEVEQQQIAKRINLLTNLLKMRLARTLAANTQMAADEPSQLDFQLYRQNNIQPFFVTDLDSTAWNGDISTIFLAYMIDRKLVKLTDNSLIIPQLKRALAETDKADSLVKLEPTALLKWALTTFESGGKVNGLELFNLVCAATYGYTFSELAALADQLITVGSENIAPFNKEFYGEQLVIYRYLQEKGASGWAISAGLDFLAIAGARHLGINNVRASTLLYDEAGRSLGKCGHNIFTIKDEEVLNIANELNGLPIAAYGDSIASDTPMFLWADLVNRILEDDHFPQLALAPEFKAKREDDTKTPLLIDQLNSEFGTAFEFHKQPTFDEIHIIP